MTRITTLKFNSYNELQNQFVTWIKVLPSIFGVKCQLYDHNNENSWQLVFQSESLASFKSLYLHEVANRIESTKTLDDSDNFEYLWVHLRWETYDVKQEALYCLLPTEKVSALVRKAFRLKLFDLQYQAFRNKQILLKVMFAPRYLILWINEQLNCPVYWLDSYGTFMAYGKRHPLSTYWAKDETLRIVNEKEILNLGEFDLRFRDIRAAITWKYDLQEKSLISVSEQLNIEIHIRLRKDNSRNQAKASLWFYERQQRQELEDWITRLSRDQREEYLLLSSEAPFEGYFLRIKDEVRPELVSPPPTTRRFRILFEGESVYVPTDSRLEPDIPFSEFQKIFDPQVGTSMIFWQEEEDLSLIKLDDVRFDELQSLVNYV
ncbi:MAG: hypothetical protein VX619_10555, partial [bacterium]|nr:hypothetical protein [bacterium]